MVRQLCFILCALLMLPLVADAAELLLELEGKAVELGKPVNAKLYAVSLKKNLSDINLEALKTDFGIVINDNAVSIKDRRWPGLHVQLLNMKLYPRRSGDLKVPSVSIQKLATHKQLIHVTEGMSNSAPISYKSEISEQSVWERQQLVIGVVINTPDRFASLHIDKPDIPGFEIIPVPSTRESLASGNRLLRTGWLLFPLAPGRHTIELPPVQYRLGGLYQRIYFPPIVTINVKPLPPYIPPTIPVGKVTISSKLEPATLLRTDHLSYWRVNLNGTSVLPFWLPPVLRQIKTNNEVQFLSVDSQRTTTPDRLGVHGQVVHHIPLKPLSNGRVLLPGIRFQYFDPDSARLVTIKHRAQNPIAISLFLRIILICLFAALVLVLGKKTLSMWRVLRENKQKYNGALARISHSEDTTSLRSALRSLADAEQWPTNLSLSDWLRYRNTHYQTDDSLEGLINNISRMSYGKHASENFSEIRDQLVTALHSQIKVKKPYKKPVSVNAWIPENFVYINYPGAG